MMGGVMMSAGERPKGYTLPNALDPFADESLIGLLVRTAQGHRFHDPMRLFRRIKPRTLPTDLWTFCQQDPQSEEGRAVRTLLGLDQPTFNRMTMWTGDDATLAVQGWPVWNELVRNKARSVCSLCLQEASYHRASWLVNAFPVCAIHGVWLRDVCHNPECRRPLSWSGTGVHRCGNRRCRHDLRQAPVEHCDPSVLGGIAALTRILNSADVSGGPLAMPPGVAIRMSFALGMMSLELKQSVRPPSFISRERGRMPAMMDAGWNALDDWPNGFHAFLDHQKTRAAERPGRHGLHKAFGEVARRMHAWSREPWGAAIGVAFADYAAGCADLGTTSSYLRRYAPGTELRRLHLSRGEAQRLLGLAADVMQPIAERRGMFVLPPRGAGVPSLLKADDVRQLQAELKDHITPEKARATVGAGRKIFDRLEAEGFFSRMPDEEQLVPSRPYRKSQIEAFVNACIGKAKCTTRAAANDAGLTPLVKASAPGRPLSDICRALMAGRLQSVAIATDARGLTQIRLRMSELERKLPAQRDTLSITDAARLLGTTPTNLYEWARYGFLETHASDRPAERGQRVSLDACQQFGRDYIHTGEFPIVIRRRRSTVLARQFALEGVLQVSGPGVDKAQALLFRRADITPEVISHLVQGSPRQVETTREKKRQTYARVAFAAAVVGSRWGTHLEQANNSFTDLTNGRVLQVVSGARHSGSDFFKFMIAKNSLLRLQTLPDVWLALVPSASDTFIFAPFSTVTWQGMSLEAPYVMLRFDDTGTPLDMPEWAMPLSAADSQRTGTAHSTREVNV